MQRQNSIGEIGEELASQYLIKNGYKILERNYRGENRKGLQRGEIDIVAKRGEAIHFIEVKTSLVPRSRSKEQYFRPENRVSQQKKVKMLRIVQAWLAQHRIHFDSKWQIDVLAVRIDKETNETHINYFPGLPLFDDAPHL
jgi:putative endonuclease